MNKDLTIGLAGLGTVGGGLVELLKKNMDHIINRSGRKVILKSVLVRDKDKYLSVKLPDNAVLTDNMDDLINDNDIDVIVELIGGIDSPYKLITEALNKGKHIVTANKALLAEHGQEIFKKAKESKCIIRYEASCAGAIPIVEVLKSSMTGNQVISLMGILNGTSNYILSEMTSNGLDFSVALKQAQEKGYAEADPTLDVDGFDAAHKLVVLIRLAYGLHYPFKDLSVTGIRHITPLDISFAREFGYRIKLIGQVKEVSKNTLAAGVFPALVKHNDLLARVGEAFNAVRIEADACGQLFLHGRGAGALPTAGAVLADILAVSNNININNTGFVNQDLPECKIMNLDKWQSLYYVRLMVEDAPGVLRDISACMADEGISVAQMIQKAGSNKYVPLVFMTHETSAFAMQNALRKMQNQGLCKEQAISLRVF